MKLKESTIELINILKVILCVGIIARHSTLKSHDVCIWLNISNMKDGG